MSLFLSVFTNLIGHQGRVSMPSTFRSQLSQNQVNQTVVLYRSFTNKCIEGCSTSRMELLSDASDNLDIFSKDQNSINSLIFADARQLGVDSAGRISIPADLLEYAGIKKEACFVGCGKTFQIWEPSVFKKYQDELRADALKNRPTLKINN